MSQAIGFLWAPTTSASCASDPTPRTEENLDYVKANFSKFILPGNYTEEKLGLVYLSSHGCNTMNIVVDKVAADRTEDCEHKVTCKLNLLQ